MRRRDTVRAALFAAFAAIAAYLLLTRDGGLAGGGDASPADERSDVGPIGDAAPTPIDAAPAARLDVHGTTRSASGSIRLRVVDGDTRLPVAAAAIIVAGVAANGKRLEVSAETGEDGNAVVAKVAVGEGYVVRVAPPAVRPIERRDVAVREDDVTDLGTIYTAAHGVVEGVVVDDNGKPLASVAVGATMDPATLGAFDADPFPQPIGFATPIESVTTDAAGAFRFASLPLGLVALRADLEGYRTAIDRALVEKKAAAARVRIVLTRGVTFRGRVEGGEGKGIAHALVEIGTSERGAFGVRVAVETDADGNFEAQGFAAVRNLSPAVRVTAPDRTPVLFERVRPVEEFMRLVLRGGAHLEITVLDAWRESPVADALVTQVRAPDRDDTVGMGRYEATTDGRGRAVLHLPAGTAARPTLLARGYLTGAIVEEHGSLTGKNLRYRGDVVLPLGDGETRSLVVWMRHGPLVMGSVRDATGVLLARARVRAEYPDGKRGATVETDGAGEYRLSDVAVPSRPEIVARSWDGLSDAREKIPPVWRDEEQAIRIDLRLAPVLDPSALSGAAAPLAGASKALARATVRGRNR